MIFEFYKNYKKSLCERFLYAFLQIITLNINFFVKFKKRDLNQIKI